MKKLVFTLAIAVFFVTFSNAQSTDEKAADAKQSVELTSVSKEKVACEPGCTKECCADKKAECTDKKATSKKASLRPSSCADKKTSCKGKKTSCKDKKATKSVKKASSLK